MRTSHLQYVMMVEFMERNGDLSKPSGGPRGRNFVQMKWKELTNKLNSDGTGDSRSEEKWRKVWSDLKNNTKKKFAKIKRATDGTGGGPALNLSMTDLENRVIQIIGVQAATGMLLDEAGFQRVVDHPAPPIEIPEVSSEIFKEDWDTPSTSTQRTIDTPVPPPEVHLETSPVATVEEEWKPPPKKCKKTFVSESNNVAKILIDSDTKAREYARERDRIYEEMERKRLRLKDEELKVRELDIRERVRQRDVELQLQGAWLEFMKEAMVVFARYMDAGKKDMDAGKKDMDAGEKD